MTTKASMANFRPISTIKTSIGVLCLFPISAAHQSSLLKTFDLSINEIELHYIKNLFVFVCYLENCLKEGKYKPDEPVLTLEDVNNLSEEDLEGIAKEYVSAFYSKDKTLPPKKNDENYIYYLYRLSYNEQEEIKSFFNPLYALLKKQTEKFHSLFFGISEEAEKKLPSVSKELIKHGWYFDMGMPYPWIQRLALKLEKPNNIEQIEEIFQEYFVTGIDNIESNIISKYSNREHILKDAFEAHRQGKYNLSIPIFIIQADGISKEILGENYFNGKKSKIKQFIEVGGITGLDKICLESLLGDEVPISQSTRKEDEIPNRHYILHGNALKYGTKINSLRIVSFLNFIVNLPLIQKVG